MNQILTSSVGAVYRKRNTLSENINVTWLILIQAQWNLDRMPHQQTTEMEELHKQLGLLP